VAPDVGDTLSAGLLTGLGTTPGNNVGHFSKTSRIGNGPNGAKDVDLYRIDATAGDILNAQTFRPTGGFAIDTYLRLFNSAGTEITHDDDGGSDFHYSRLANYTFLTSGTFYIGISGYSNTAYNPTSSGSGTPSSTQGDYRLDITLDPRETIATAHSDGIGTRQPTYSWFGYIGDGPQGTKDVDMFLVWGLAGQRLTAGTYAVFNGQNVDTVLRVFDSSGTQLTYDDDSGSNYRYSRIANFYLPADGYYYIGVSAYGNTTYDPNVAGSGAAGLSVGDYQLTLDIDTADDLSHASNTQIGSLVSHFTQVEMIANGGYYTLDVDLYRIDAQAGNRISAKTSIAAGFSTVDTYLRLFNSSGTQIAFDDDGGTDYHYSLLNYNVTAAGTYYLGVSGYPNNTYNPNVIGSGTSSSSVGSYKLDIDLDVGETIGTSNETGLGIAPTLGGSMTYASRLGISAYGLADVDMYHVRATKGSTLTAETTPILIFGTDVDTVLRVFNSSGVQVAFDDDSGSYYHYSRISYSVPATGDYYIGVSGYSNSSYNPNSAGSGVAGSGPGDYALSLSVASPADVPDVLSGALDTGLGGAGGSFALTAVIGDGLYGQLDRDLYKFQVVPGTILTATTSLPSGGQATDTYMRLFDAAGNQVVADDDSGPDFHYSKIANYIFNSTGTYYIGVSGYPNSAYNPAVAGSGSNSTSFGDYTLTLNLVPHSLSIADVSITEGDSGTTNATFTITLSAPSTDLVTVDFATSAGTATAGSDYTTTLVTLVFGVGQTTRTVSVPIIGDTVAEANETFFATLSNASRATISRATATGTILNNDPLPAIAVADAKVAEGNTGTKNLKFTFTLVGANDQTVTATYSTANGTATAGSDYTAKSGTITFAPGATTASITVQIIGDSAVEPDETFFVNITGVTHAAIVDGQALGTILNDDVSVSINDVSVVEGDTGFSLASFIVSIPTAVAFPVSVHYATANDTATAGADYSAIAGDLTIPAGSTSVILSVPVFGDTRDEPNETFHVTLSAPVNATTAVATGTATIIDNDPLPSLSINDVAVVEGNSGSKNVTFTVTLSAASGQAVSVNYATNGNGTATLGTDYTAASGTLTFPAGTTTKTLTVGVFGDTTSEPNETFKVALSAATNATIAGSIGTGTILNDDPTPSISIADASTTEGDSGTKKLNLKVTLSSASASAVTVNYATSDGTATAGSDYVAASGTLTIPAGKTSGTISVMIKGDTSVEANEALLVTLSAPSGASLGASQATGTITNDDTSITIADASMVEGDSGAVAMVFTLTLSGGPRSFPITVTYATTNGVGTTSALAGKDYAATTGTLTIAGSATTATIIVPVLGDLISEPNETFTLKLTSPTGAILNGTGIATGTIIDNDPAPRLVINDVSLTEGNVGTKLATFTVSLVNAAGQLVTSGSDVSVNYATANNTASAGSDYVAIPTTTLTIPAGSSTATFTVTINGDSLVEPNESFFINLSTPISAVIADGQGIGLIVNDDGDALRIAGGRSRGDAQDLSPAVLSRFAAVAANRWRMAGVSKQEWQMLRTAPISIADLPADELGVALDGAITIDRNAAGRGWHAAPSSSVNRRGPARIAASREVDLLTVIEHEMGHLLGLDHNARAGSVMNESIDVGERRNATARDLATMPISVRDRALDDLMSQTSAGAKLRQTTRSRRV
jgi:hypothetical protein